MRLFFVINQDPLDGSAHALYVLRHLRSLARAGASEGRRVRLVCPVRRTVAELAAALGGEFPPEFEVASVASWRRGPDGRGFSIGAVFHHAAWRHLRRESRPGDLVASASFPKLLDFLGRRVAGHPRLGLRLAYEVHQLEELSLPASHRKVRLERAALARVSRLVTTTDPLRSLLQANFPGITCRNLGLACGYPPPEFLPPVAAPLRRAGYFGSVSPEQGVPWLVEVWPAVRAAAGPVELHLYGRLRRGEAAPPARPEHGVVFHPHVPSPEVPAVAAGMDVLLIPALAVAHRPSIAFTKAYDYAGLARPVVAADLPTIREVLRDGVEARLHQPGDAAGLAAAVAELAADPALRQRLQEGCRQRARGFSWPERARRWWEFVGP